MEEQLYGDVAGSKPDWFLANFHDKGRAHIHSKVVSELGTTTLEKWYSGSQCEDHLQGGSKRMYTDKHCASVTVAGPVVVGGNRSYLMRRSIPQDQDMGYRRAIKFIPEPLQPGKPEGKRYIPPPPCDIVEHSGKKSVAQQTNPDRIPEPALPRYGRPEGISCLRESDTEVSFERYVGRKVQCRLDGFYRTGRAGDLSVKQGVAARVEDEARYFQQLKDSPTFLRFTNSLPPPAAVSPHVRRAAAEKRMHQARLDQEREMVRQLHIEVPDD